MKTLKISTFFAMAMLSLFSIKINAQSATQTDTSFIVNGVCRMCQFTIESAADFEGVENVAWDVEAKVLSFSFSPEVTSVQAINDSVNASGYDSEFATADERAYQNLHGCCKYRDPKVVEEHK